MKRKEHWRARHQALLGRGRTLQAIMPGVRHKSFCVGRCWTVMLRRFAAGGATPGCMLGLSTVRFMERAVPWGRCIPDLAGQGNRGLDSFGIGQDEAAIGLESPVGQFISPGGGPGPRQGRTVGAHARGRTGRES